MNTNKSNLFFNCMDFCFINFYTNLRETDQLRSFGLLIISLLVNAFISTKITIVSSIILIYFG